jgi:hypothetical protein
MRNEKLFEIVRFRQRSGLVGFLALLGPFFWIFKILEVLMTNFSQ